MTYYARRLLLLVSGTVAGMIFMTATAGAATVGGPGETALRAAIQAAQAGDTIEVSSSVQLQSLIRIDKRLTIRAVPSLDPVLLQGAFAGGLFQIAADGVTFEGLTLKGSPQTDGLLVEKDVILRDCVMQFLRSPVVDGWTHTGNAVVRLERVRLRHNELALICLHLEAKDSTFSFSGEAGAVVFNAYVDGCVFENNEHSGLVPYNGTVKNCLFRSNGGYGVYFEPDPGMLTLSNCLFYANGTGGMRLGEGAAATVDNCTFTRHTGPPAIIVTENGPVLFRHCTVVDNVYIESSDIPTPKGGSFVITGGAKLQNCIVADNPTDSSPNDSGLIGPWTDAGGNVIGGAANFGPLRDNGGPLMTLAPLPGSPAIDAGLASDLVLDTRGLSRLAGVSPDAGAVESGATPSADSDGDGIPDLWEVRHGLNPSAAGDAASDMDGDGQNARSEFHSRTDPADGTSTFVTETFEYFAAGTHPFYPLDAERIFLTWKQVPGVTYQVETSTDALLWRRVPGAIQRDWSSSMMVRFEAPSAAPRAFFRVRAGASPFD